MGTRSTTHIFELREDGTPIAAMLRRANKNHLVSIYRQFDGYPDGHGKELFDFAKNMTIVNGFTGGMKAGTHANGAGCFAAQLVKHFKEDIGGIYITTKDDRQEYDYFLYVRGPGSNFGGAKPTDPTIYLVLKSGKDTLFSGTILEYDVWLAKYAIEQNS